MMSVPDKNLRRLVFIAFGVRNAHVNSLNFIDVVIPNLFQSNGSII